MLERLTDEALRALVAAKAIARELQHECVDAPHVLLGVLQAGETTAGGDILGRAGLRYDDLLVAVAQAYRRVGDERMRGPVLTLEAKKLLELALNEAQMEGGAAVTTTQLALACSCGQLPAVEPFVAGRGPAIRVHAGRSPGVPPVRDREQRRAALARANAVRTRRATLKRDLRDGRAEIDAIIGNPPDYVQSAKLFDLLLAVPKFGRVKVNKVLSQARISPSKTIGGLSARQRDELVRLLRR